MRATAHQSDLQSVFTLPALAYNQESGTPIKYPLSPCFYLTCGIAIACGRWGEDSGASLQRLVVFFIYILLVMSDKQYKIGWSSRGKITQQHRKSGSMSSTQLHFGYTNTPLC